MKILDIGCGRGENCFDMKLRYPEAKVYGIDIEEKNIKKAKKEFGNKCEFLVARGEKLPFKDSSFDFIYAIEVLEHVNNLEATISEIRRLLKGGGRAIITFPNKKSEEKFLELNKKYLNQIGHKRIIDDKDFVKRASSNFNLKCYKKYNSIEHLFWVYLFRKKYKIINENGDVDRPIPRILKLVENILNPDKTHFPKKKVYFVIKILNKMFSPLSKIFDIFFIKKRVKLILEKK
ncbi:MAG: class I SAM-dependent methyltransferase [archaeon]